MNDVNRILRAADFAAKKHKIQKRKGANAEPYINHPLEVARILAETGEIEDIDILVAAILHDTIEDTDATPTELTALFGERVCNFVLEVSDDKSLSKEQRKEMQVKHAPHLSTGAKQIKLADKISNIRDALINPPADWSIERRIQYMEWGERVGEGLRGANERLEKLFDEEIEKAKIHLNRKL